MKYVIASASDRVVAACRDFLGDGDGLTFRSGSVPEAGWDCDIAVLSFPLAHERYGGKPQVGRAQVLANERSDGAPKIILATPPLALTAASSPASDSDIERHVFGVLNSCVAAYVNAYGRGEDVKILIHLEAAALDRPDLLPPLRGIADFLARERTGEA